MKFKYKIIGVDCPVCASKLANKMAKVEGVDRVTINFLLEKLTVESELPEAELLALLRITAEAFEDGIEIK